MASFDELLDSLHSGISDEPEAGYIQITEKRQFVPSENFDTIIAYEGDINSQIITFHTPTIADGHSLSDCDEHKIKCKNLASGHEGVFDLVAEGSGIYKWAVPPSMCTQAGTIEISVHFYDWQNEDKKTIAYSWNTSTYSGLTIGQSNRNIGNDFPARDEILVIDKETRNIVAPQGYRNTICNYGEVGVSSVYFQINRYLDKKMTFDIMDPTTVIKIYAYVGGRYYSVDTTTIEKRTYTPEVNETKKDSLVLIKWNVEEGITAGTFGAGKLRIAIEFKHNGKIWISNEYGNLEIGRSILQVDVNPQPDITTLDAVAAVVEGYLLQNEFVIDPN